MKLYVLTSHCLSCRCWKRSWPRQHIKTWPDIILCSGPLHSLVWEAHLPKHLLDWLFLLVNFCVILRVLETLSIIYLFKFFYILIWKLVFIRVKKCTRLLQPFKFKSKCMDWSNQMCIPNIFWDFWNTNIYRNLSRLLNYKYIQKLTAMLLTRSVQRLFRLNSLWKQMKQSMWDCVSFLVERRMCAPGTRQTFLWYEMMELVQWYCPQTKVLHSDLIILACLESSDSPHWTRCTAAP